MCLYRAPTGDITEFLFKTEILLSQLPISSGILVCGDLNVNYLNVTDIHTQSLSRLLENFGLNMFVEDPTRITSHSATLLDYLRCNSGRGEVECEVVNARLSDHNAIYCQISMNQGTITTGRRTSRFTKRNFSQFDKNSRAIQWDDILRSKSPLHTFHEVLVDCFDVSFPIRTLRSRT